MRSERWHSTNRARHQALHYSSSNSSQHQGAHHKEFGMLLKDMLHWKGRESVPTLTPARTSAHSQQLRKASGSNTIWAAAVAACTTEPFHTAPCCTQDQQHWLLLPFIPEATGSCRDLGNTMPLPVPPSSWNAVQSGLVR